MTRTPAQQAAYDRIMGTAETVREQAEAGIIEDRYAPAATPASAAAAPARPAWADDRYQWNGHAWVLDVAQHAAPVDNYLVTTSQGARAGFAPYASAPSRGMAITFANRLHDIRVSNGAEGVEAVRVERFGEVIWAIRDNGQILA